MTIGGRADRFAEDWFCCGDDVDVEVEDMVVAMSLSQDFQKINDKNRRYKVASELNKGVSIANG